MTLNSEYKNVIPLSLLAILNNIFILHNLKNIFLNRWQRFRL